MINRAVLTGRLTRDPELKAISSGISVAVFTIAVNRQYTDTSGNRGTDFISCVIWRKSAENFCKFTSKGSLLGIDGLNPKMKLNHALHRAEDVQEGLYLDDKQVVSLNVEKWYADEPRVVITATWDDTGA